MSESTKSEDLCARRRLVDASIEIMKRADAHNYAVTALLEQADLAVSLAELPGDMPLRVWLQPGVFEIKA